MQCLSASSVFVEGCLQRDRYDMMFDSMATNDGKHLENGVVSDDTANGRKEQVTVDTEQKPQNVGEENQKSMNEDGNKINNGISSPGKGKEEHHIYRGRLTTALRCVLCDMGDETKNGAVNPTILFREVRNQIHSNQFMLLLLLQDLLMSLRYRYPKKFRDLRDLVSKTLMSFCVKC